MSHPAPIFVSHGAPNLVLHQTPARAFLLELGHSIGRPDAIVVASAHYEWDAPRVSGDAKPETIHDFGNFERELFAMRYPAPGAPELAREIAALITASGTPARVETRRGFDHGTWVPLMLMYPDADIPVVQVSVAPKAGPDYHIKLGAALASLPKRNILVIGSGAVTHNLGAFFHGGFARDDAPEPWVGAFADWMSDRLAAGDRESLIRYRVRAPFGAENHPTEEHLLPLFVALGAAGAGAHGTRLHHSGQYGVLAMDVYRFAIP